MRFGGIRRVVLDTNVWVSGLINPAGDPGQLVRAFRERRLDVVISWELAEELAATLRKPKLARYNLSEDDAADILTLVAPRRG